jgi:hypothetical protein
MWKKIVDIDICHRICFLKNINKKMEIVDDLENCTPPEVRENATGS